MNVIPHRLQQPGPSLKPAPCKAAQTAADSVPGDHVPMNSPSLRLCLACILTLILSSQQAGAGTFPQDTIATAAGPLTITFVHHASLIFAYQGRTIHIDPVDQQGEYRQLPKADLVLITHQHYDHFDPRTLAQIAAPDTPIIANPAVIKKLGRGKALNNGDRTSWHGITISAHPAYNLVHKRANGQPFHPKGRDNGYLFTFSNRTVYVAGDTEAIPELSQLAGVDIAFLPMNLPYTMSLAMAAQAVELLRPRILYPYHYSGTDPAGLAALLNAQTRPEIRLRNMP